MTDVFIAAVAALLIGTVVSILRSALIEEFPAMAEWLVRLSARRMPSHLQDRYRDEWLAELEAVADRHSKLSVLLWAVRIRVRVRSTARALGLISARRTTSRIYAFLVILQETLFSWEPHLPPRSHSGPDVLADDFLTRAITRSVRRLRPSLETIEASELASRIVDNLRKSSGGKEL